MDIGPALLYCDSIMALSFLTYFLLVFATFLLSGRQKCNLF